MPRKKGTTAPETGADTEELKTGTDALGSGTGGRKTGTGRSKSGTGAQKRRKKHGYTMSEAALIARSKGGQATMQMVAKTPEEMAYNARSVEHVMRITEIAQHADKSNIDSLHECFVAYLKLCAEDGFKVGNIGAAAAMGMDHSELVKMSKNATRPEHRKFAQMVRQTCSLIREGMIADQKINPVIGIFWQRNYDGLRNDTEQQQGVENNDGETLTADEYRQKYSDLLDE